MRQRSNRNHGIPGNSDLFFWGNSESITVRLANSTPPKSVSWSLALMVQAHRAKATRTIFKQDLQDSQDE